MRIIVSERCSGKTEKLVDWFTADPSERYVAVQNETLRSDFIFRALNSRCEDGDLHSVVSRRIINIGYVGGYGRLAGISGHRLAIDDVDILNKLPYGNGLIGKEWVNSIAYETIAKTGIPNIAIMTATGPSGLSRPQ